VFFTLLALGLGVAMLVGVLSTVKSDLGKSRKSPRLQLPGGDVDTTWAREIASSTGDACDVRIDYVTRGTGTDRADWTYISFALPTERPVFVQLVRPHPVDGAPSDVVQALQKQSGLARFLELLPKMGMTELRTLRDPNGDTRLVICVGETLYRNLLRDALLAVVEIVRGIPVAYVEPRLVDGDGPYRGMMADTLALRDRRTAELAAFMQHVMSWDG
jgi:hypothetical protein